MGSIRASLAALLVAVLLACPAGAAAATWQGPAAVSDPAEAASDTPQLAMGPAGDGAVAWWGLHRVLLARHLAGGAWSAPVGIGNAQSPLTPVVGVDAHGTVTAAWSEADGLETVIATWPAAAPWPTLTALDASAPLIVSRLAVNASGAAVLAGESGAYAVAAAYRGSAGGSFDFTVETGTMGGPARDAQVAINAGSDAVLLYRQGDSIWASRRPAAAGAFGPLEEVNAGFMAAATPSDLSVALDAAGNALAAFTLFGGNGTALASAWSPPGGGWTLQWPLSPYYVEPQGATQAAHPRVVVGAGGAAALVWLQLIPSETAQRFVDVRLGSSATGAWGALETAVPTGYLTSPPALDFPPDAVFDASGALTVASEAGLPTDPRSLQTVVRTRAPDGTWAPLVPLAAVHSVQSPPSLAVDAAGHVALAAAPNEGPFRKVVNVWVFDPIAPTVSPVSVAGSRLAGDSLSLSVTPADTWSPTTVQWDLGDGTSAAGASIAHAYDAAGTYVATATVTDAAGNVTSTRGTVQITAKRAALAAATFKATWKRSRVHGTLLLRGTAPRAGAYVFSVRRGGRDAITRTLQLAGGDFTRTITLPARMLPGRYTLTLAPPFPATQVLLASRDATLGAPAAGVVDRVTVTRKGGALHARFHFVVVAKGRLGVTWWVISKGRRTLLARQTKAARATITATVTLRGRHGRVTVIVTRAGAVVEQRSLTVR